MTEEHYAPETTLYFESQKSFDDLTIQNKIKYHFEKHHFSNITFSADNIVGNLKNCTFRNCAFINFDGENISFENASFNNCRIINSNLKKCNFERAGMAYLQIINSDFTDSNFAAAKIGDTRFDGNNLSGVKFHGATLDDVIITDATVDKPVEGLYSENISMDGATFQELEVSRNRIFSELKLEPNSFEQVAEQAKAGLEPLPESVLKSVEPITKQTVVVNCFAGPGAGKTTCAWEIASELKKRGIEAEYVGEYAKELVWDGNTELLDGSLKSQQQLYDVQNHRVQRLLGKVDVVVTDSPAILGAMYLKQPNAEFESKIIKDFRQQHNFNLFINRGDTFQQIGRIHNLEESKIIDNNIKEFLDRNEIYYGTYEHSTVNKVVENIQTHLKTANNLSLSNNHPADELVDEHSFYKPSISPNEKVLKLQQYTIINEFNPAPNTYQTWIRSADDIKTFEDALKDSDWEGWEKNGFDESYTSQVVQDAMDSGKITVYSSHPIEQGVFVTPSPMEAQSYSGDGKIYSKEVNLNAVAWIDPTQGQYANVEEYATQMHSKQLNIETPVPEIQKNQPTLAEQKIAEVKEKLSNPQISTKPLTNEEFDIFKGEIVDIAKNYQANPKLAAELFAFKTQFYQYSLNNTLLIHLQNPHATFVTSLLRCL